MSVQRIPRKALLPGLIMVLLLLCLLVLLGTNTSGEISKDNMPNESVTMKPGPSRVKLDHVHSLVNGVEEGKQFSLVHFESGREEWLKEDKQGNPYKIYPVATRISGQLDPDKPHRIWVGGTFTLTSNLHRLFFTKWGQVEDSVPVNASRGIRQDKDCSRLYALLPPRESESPTVRLPVPPVTLLALMPRSAKRPTDGSYIGPLTGHDVRAVPDLVTILASEPVGKLAVSRAEQLLDSTNCWVAWLGLARLRDLKVLKTEHFARAVGSRVPEDAAFIAWEIWDLVDMNPTMKTDLSEQLVRLGKTPRMQEALLQSLIKQIQDHRASNQGKTGPVDLPATQRAAREYRDTIKDDASSAVVLRQLEALIGLQ